jgi:hypothetical protein
MSRSSLINRVRRIESVRGEEELERHVVCPIPYEDPMTEGRGR